MAAAPFYREALVILGAAAVVIPLIHRLRISPVIGYILIGLVVGPYGLGALAQSWPWLTAVTISDPASIAPIAELGVALLLFMIGLELSFERLRTMRRLVFGLGLLQVLLSAALITAAAVAFNIPITEATIIGTALAMSSTAVVIQVLSEEKRLATQTGRAAFAILLLQDLAVVPVLLALGSLGHGVSLLSLLQATAWAAASVIGIVALGRLVLRPLFRGVARTRNVELFVAACLLVVMATGLATEAAGLSMALGALIGGLLLAGTEYRRQVEVTIDPFKGLFVGVFLISIGTGLDIRILIANPALVLGIALGVVALKLAIVAGLSRAFSLPWRAGLQAGLLLGPGGEFGFVILSTAAAEHLLPARTAGTVVFVTALTMASIPFLSKLGQRLTTKKKTPADHQIPADVDGLPRVIIAGFGRVGQTVAALLEAHKLHYIAIDQDPDRVARQRRHGKPVYFGDMTQPGLLRHLHLDTARAMVITIDEPKVASELVAAARAERADLLIVARARDARHASHLYRVGASDAVPEAIEASLQMSEAVLVDLGVAMGPVIVSIHEKRAELQAAIKAMAPGAEIRTLGRRRLRDGW